MKVQRTIPLFYLAMLLCNSQIQAEEHVWQVNDIVGKNTIIRDVDATHMLVCGEKNNHYYSFTLVSTGTGLHPEMTVFVDSIFDFEVYNGSDVYFCGSTKNGTGSYAMLGHFSLTGFPYSTVEYVSLPWFYRLRKIDIGWFSNRLHMVAIGDAVNGKNAVVDAITNSSYWQIYYSMIDTNNKCRLSDVAITDSFVVATSTYKNGLLGFLHTRIWYIPKPTGSGNTLQFSTCRYQNVNETATTPLLIKWCEGDVFVTVAKDYMTLHGYVGTPSTSFFRVKAYDGYLSIHSVFWGYESYINPRLKDISYDPDNKVLDCLINVGSNSSQHNVVYHLNQPLSLNPGFAKGHAYDDIAINSLDKKASQPGHFIAVGNPVAETETSYLLKYKYDIWNSCFDTDSVYVSFETPNYTPIDNGLVYNNVLLVPQKTYTDTKEHQKMTVCHSNKQ